MWGRGRGRDEKQTTQKNVVLADSMFHPELTALFSTTLNSQGIHMTPLLPDDIWQRPWGLREPLVVGPMVIHGIHGRPETVRDRPGEFVVLEHDAERVPAGNVIWRSGKLLSSMQDAKVVEVLDVACLELKRQGDGDWCLVL